MIFKESTYRKLYFYVLIVLAFSLPLSIFASSFLQFVLVGIWFFEGNYRNKWQRLKKNKAYWIFNAFFLIHIIGLAWTKDYTYGLQDLKIKLPLLVIPFILVSIEEFETRNLRFILSSFILGCIVGSIASVMALTGILSVEIVGYRDASLFIHHIRFSLMISLAIMLAGYLLFERKENIKVLNPLYIFALLWLPVFLIVLRSLSGIVVLLVLIFYMALFFATRVKDRVIRFMINVAIVFIPLFVIIYIGNAVNRFYNTDELIPEELELKTLNGNPYIHNLEKRDTENGHYVWIYICLDELKSEWAKRSEYPYWGKTDSGDMLRHTLIRYMSSKGLRKDSVGMSRMEEADIRAVEKGIANHIYLEQFALYPRVYEVIWEIDRFNMGYSANDKSVVQRYLYLKAGYSISVENLLIGVGTGDVREAFEEYYTETDSPLKLKRRRRAHNQYLTLIIALGIPGLIISLAAFLLPVFLQRKWNYFPAVIFLITMATSMLSEDTLENTPGVVMFALFYSLFILTERR